MDPARTADVDGPYTYISLSLFLSFCFLLYPLCSCLLITSAKLYLIHPSLPSHTKMKPSLDQIVATLLVTLLDFCSLVVHGLNVPTTTTDLLDMACSSPRRNIFLVHVELRSY